MRPLVTFLVRSICLLLMYVLAQTAEAQVRIGAHPSAAAHPQDAAAVELNLCIQGSASSDMCPEDKSEPYVPAITYTYGQVLDGVAHFPDMPLDGFATISANGIVFCTLYQSMPTTPCPANSTNFAPGKYTLLLVYTDPDTGTTTTGAPVDITVLQDATAKFTLTSSLNPAPVGTAVTFTVVALGAYNEPATGTVTFTDGSNPLGQGNLDMNGTAEFTTSTLAMGTHIVHASYPGSIDLSAPPDATLSQVIVPPMTTTTLTSSVNPSAFGQNVTFTAGVAASTPGLHPAGAVSFSDGTKTFATVVVSPQGLAPTSISTLASGTHNITANYSGDAATGPSVSSVLVQQVTYPLTQAGYGFTVTVTPSPVVLGVGLNADLIVTVTPRGGFSQPVTLTCGDLPHESTCTFGQAVIPASGGSTTLDLHVSSPHDCGSSTPYFYGANRPGVGSLIHRGGRYGGPALAGLLLLLLPRRRRWHRGMLALCGCLSLTGLSGCSSTCTDFGTSPGAYTFQVIGTAPSAMSGASTDSGTPLVVPTSVALTVKI